MVSSSRAPKCLGWLGVSVGTLAVLASAQQPQLEHSAPILGREFTLSLRGAPPLARVTLLSSPRPAHLETPFGTLELERASLAALGFGLTDANGEWNVTWDVPLERALAESPQHLQVFVRPSGSAPSLSEAVHLRWLGSRAYVTTAQGIEVFSTTQPQRVMIVEPSLAANGCGRPVFDVDHAHAAVVVPEGALVFFDTMFGRTFARREFPGAHSMLLSGASSDFAWAFAPSADPPSLRAFDLRDGEQVAEVVLPSSSYAGAWVIDGQGGFAYLARVGLPLRVERVDLWAGQVLDEWPIGLPTSESFRSFASTPDGVLIGSDELDPTWCHLAGALTEIRATSSGAAITTVPWPGGNSLVVAADMGVIVHTAKSWVCGPGAASISLTRVDHPLGPATSVEVMGYFDSISRVVPSRAGLWVKTWDNDLHARADASFAPENYWGENLWFVDYATHQWVYEPLTNELGPMCTFSVSNDAFGERLCVVDRTFQAPSFLERPQLFVLDPATREWSAFALQSEPNELELAPLVR